MHRVQKIACSFFCLLLSTGLVLASPAQAQEKPQTIDELFQAAREFREENKPNKARDSYLQILELLQDEENLRIRAATYNNLGALAANKGDLDKAETYYNDSLATRKHLGDQHGVADTYHNLGNIAQLRGDFESASDWYKQSLTVRESLGDTAGLIHTYNALGYVAVARGVQNAIGKISRYFYGYLASKDIIGGADGAAKIYRKFGSQGQINKDLNEAHSFYEQALALSEDLNNRLGLASSYSHLGEIAQIRREWSRAISFYDRAIEQYESVNDQEQQIGLATVYNHLGNISVKRGDFGSAEEWYNQSLTLYQSMEDKAGQIRIYVGLAILSYEEKSYLTAAWRFIRIAWKHFTTGTLRWSIRASP